VVRSDLALALSMKLAAIGWQAAGKEA